MTSTDSNNNIGRPTPIKLPALRITQPLGEFYVTKIAADLLLQLTFSDPLRVVKSSTGFGYLINGAQRRKEQQRLTEIGKYIGSTEAAFPNAIILGANYDEDGHLADTEDRRWHINHTEGSDFVHLVIPTYEKLASIIDGQHRLDGFGYAGADRTNMELLCAVYLDLPHPYQAYLFATINFNQKKVSRSQAYELFAFDLENEAPNSWSPEKVAVYIIRKLNTERDSAIFNRVIIAAQDSQLAFDNLQEHSNWSVSMATMVDGLLRLFSAKPKEDKYRMDKQVLGERSRQVLADDGTPFRQLYRESNDLVILTALKNYFAAVDSVFWKTTGKGTYIKRTVGLQALYDVFYLLMKKYLAQKDISVEFFYDQLKPAGNIDFSAERFQASGIGRSQIRKEIVSQIGLS